MRHLDRAAGMFTGKFFVLLYSLLLIMSCGQWEEGPKKY
ncbi:uncharacterized protein METZ01_LOCUS312017, partial [marine metagenome]